MTGPSHQGLLKAILLILFFPNSIKITTDKNISSKNEKVEFQRHELSYIRLVSNYGNQHLSNIYSVPVRPGTLPVITQ